MGNMVKQKYPYKDLLARPMPIATIDGLLDILTKMQTKI
jgi:hypothetical protein